MQLSPVMAEPEASSGKEGRTKQQLLVMRHDIWWLAPFQIGLGSTLKKKNIGYLFETIIK